MYILYDTTQPISDIIKPLTSIETWGLGLVSTENLQQLDWVKYRAVEVSNDLAYGSLFYDCTIKYDQTEAYIKYFPSDIGEQYGLKNEIWDGVLANSTLAVETLKHIMSPEDEQKAVNFNKFYMTHVVKDVFTDRLSQLGLIDNPVEQASWDAQREEALAYVDETSSTPTLSILASARNLTVPELVTKVLAKVSTYNIEVAKLLAKQQEVIDKINSCSTNDDCIVLREELFGIIMPVNLAVRRGLVDDEFNNRTVSDDKYGIQF